MVSVEILFSERDENLTFVNWFWLKCRHLISLIPQDGFIYISSILKTRILICSHFCFKVLISPKTVSVLGFRFWTWQQTKLREVALPQTLLCMKLRLCSDFQLRRPNVSSQSLCFYQTADKAEVCFHFKNV